jgi:drug/metabolite transporter (DMT)-like permease
MPWLFVLIWSTGFIVARYGMPFAPPMKFLAYRYLFSVVCLGAWVWLARVTWPTTKAQWGHMALTGLLMHAGYLGGVWTAVKAGMGAGLIALIVGLQPVLTAWWLSSQGAQVSRRQWLGLALGLFGLVMVVGHKLDASTEVSFYTLGFGLLALMSITLGTLYQKRWLQPCDVRSAGVIQLASAGLVTLPLALLESEPMAWDLMWGAMVWSVLVLTIGGSSLLYMLLQRGAATQVTSLLYMVPPTTAVMAWVLFDEPINALTVLGIAVTAFGVSLVVQKADKRGEKKL